MTDRRFRLSVSALLFLAAPAAALAVELPTRKPGLWDMKMTMSGGMPPMAMQQCTDAATDKQMSTMFGPAAKELCSKNDITKTATGFAIDAQCTFSGIASTSRSEITGDFASSYTMKVMTKMEGMPAGTPGSSEMTMVATWAGACKADQKPGDIVMPGGIKMNVRELEGMKGLLKK